MKVIRQINRGGYGFVDEIEDPSGKRLARKTFDPRAVDDSERAGLRRRFEREVRIQSALHHPGIMPVHQAGLGDDPPWFTMPLATRSLEEKLRDDHAKKQLDWKPWPDILSAVEELHRLGYVHRDLKPANIMLLDSNWVVSDFGLVLPTMRDTTILTGSGSAYGTRSYAAPEQASDFRNTPEQADIFALGCMLHDTVVASPDRVPFAQIREHGRYGPLIERCTEVDPKRRPSSVAALRSALFDLLSADAEPNLPPSEGDLLAGVQRSPQSPEAWRAFLQCVEQKPQDERDALMRPLNAELLVGLHDVDDLLFSRVVDLMCLWASSSGFEWDYCDVVGDRLSEIYQFAPVRLRCGIVLAALELGASHNRWHVMQQAGGMLGTAADGDLIDRLLIEIGLDQRVLRNLRKIERVIGWPRSDWHDRLVAYVSQQEGA